MVFPSILVLLIIAAVFSPVNHNGASGDPGLDPPSECRHHESLVVTDAYQASESGSDLEEITGSRSETIKYYGSPDGGKTARVWAKPVHWLDHDGIFRDYDTTLRESDDPDFPWSSKENSIECAFSSISIPDRPTVKVNVDDEEILLTPQYMEISGMNGDRIIRSTASRGKVTDDTIIYPEMYPGIDERYQVLQDELKNDHIIRERPEFLEMTSLSNNAELVIYTKVELPPGIVLVLPTRDEMDGEMDISQISLEIPNDERGRSIRMPRPVIYDSHVSEGPEMYMSGNRIQSDYHVIPLADSKKYVFIMGVRVPLSYLAADTTVYPVFIDPTLEVLQPGAADGKDNFLIDQNPNDNAGGDNSFQINVETLVALRPMIRFDLDALPDDIIVEEAKFYVKMIGHFQLGGNINTNLYRVTHEWVEGTGDYYGVNPTQDGACWNYWDGSNGWNPGGEFHGTPISSTVLNADAWYDFDVTDLVGDWINGIEPNHGMILRGMSGTDGWKRFASSDFNIYTERPRLEITYGIEPVIDNIDIHPLTGLKGDTFYFNTTCGDPDGNIVDLQWLSDRDGLISGVKEFNITTLSPGIHSISLSLRDDDGYIVEYPAGNVTVLDPPPPPVQNISAWDTPGDQGGSISISWDHVTIYDLDHYAIYVSDSGDMGNISHRQPELTLDDNDDSTIDISTMGGFSIADGVDYWVGVVAVDDLDNYIFEISAVGPVRSLDNQAPPIVKNVVAEDTPGDQGGSITVSWSPVPLGVNQQTENHFHHYNIYVLDSEFDAVLGLVPEVDDIEDSTVSTYILQTINGEPLDDLVDLYVAVTAVDSAGNEEANVSAFGPVQARDNIPPARISDLAAADRPGDQGGVVVLEWPANPEPDLHHYNIYTSPDQISGVKSLQPHGSLPAAHGPTLEYHVTGLPNNIEMYFAVTAVDREGNELYSGIETAKAWATDDISPPSISSFEANDTPGDNGGSITLCWDQCTALDFREYLIYGSVLNLEGGMEEEEPVVVIADAENCSMELRELDGEAFRHSREYYFGIAVKDMNGNVNSTVAFAGPVSAVDNIPPEIENLTYGDTTTFTRTRDNRTGYVSYDEGPHWFNATIEVETFGDEVTVTWLLDGFVIATGNSLVLNVSNVSRGHHTVLVKVEDVPFLTAFGINFTVVEHVVEHEEDGKMSESTYYLFIGLGSVFFILLVILLYFMIIVRPKRSKRLKGKGETGEKTLGKILLRKKVFALGGSAARPRMRKNVDLKDDLYYLQDDLNVQFSLKKKGYKPEGKGPCPMLDLPRTEFSCPHSVVEKCGLVCQQKDELGIEQPKGKEKKKARKGAVGKKGAKRKGAGKKKASGSKGGKGKRVSGKKGKKGIGDSKGGKKQEPGMKIPRGPKEWKRPEGSGEKGKEEAS